MKTPMRAYIVKIGREQEIRIPLAWPEELALGEEAEMALQSNQIVIRSTTRPRHYWEEQVRIMAANDDDHLLDEPVPTRWDKEAWEW